jgi:HAD superfamily hydrolase (TIGR01509 family)
MNIIIPLGGKGERFLKEGYHDPKALIKVLNKEILFYTIDCLSIQPEDHVFIVYNPYLDLFQFQQKVQEKYPNIHLIQLPGDTKGASETVLIGVTHIINHLPFQKKTVLVDGDTFYLQDILQKFRKIRETHNAVYYVKNYEKKPHFSYIEMNEQQKILRIKEKEKISDNANTGVYAFDSIYDLQKYAKFVLDNNIVFKNECYTSCIISEMIKDSFVFEGIELRPEEVVVLGTPEQVRYYEEKAHGFLFDLDGTLVITDEIYFSVWTEILKEFNIFLTKEIFCSTIQGNNDKTVFQNLLPNKVVDVQRYSSLKDTLFRKNIDKVIPVEGSEAFLKKVKNQGHKIAVVTNCNNESATAILKICGFNKYVDVLIAGDQCPKPKPYPDPYLSACKQIGLPSNKSIVFEDSKVGILSGRTVQPKCLVGMKTVFTDVELKKLGVHVCIQNFVDLKPEAFSLFHVDFTEKLKQYILTSVSSSLHITNVTVFDEKIKGGYISDVVRVELEINHGHDASLNCILKLENPNETKLSQMAQRLGLYEREYYFYENISKYINIHIPKFFGLIKDHHMNNIGILLENINVPGTVLNLNLNEEDIHVSLNIVEAAAKMHAKFWNKNLLTSFPALMKNDDAKFNPIWANYVQAQWPAFISRWKYLLNDTQIYLAQKIVENFSSIQAQLSDHNLTLLHGDIKSPNLFYRKYLTEENEERYAPYFIDWQYIGCGKGIQDIVFLMIESFDIQKCETVVPILKNFYYTKLLQNGVQNYSLEEYEKDFIHSICYYPFFVSIWFGTTPEEDLIDKNFPFFFIQKLFNFILKHVPANHFN